MSLDFKILMFMFSDTFDLVISHGGSGTVAGRQSALKPRNRLPQKGAKRRKPIKETSGAISSRAGHSRKFAALAKERFDLVSITVALRFLCLFAVSAYETAKIGGDEMRGKRAGRGAAKRRVSKSSWDRMTLAHSAGPVTREFAKKPARKRA